MTTIKSLLWVQNSNTSLPDTFVINGKIIDSSEMELRKDASDYLQLDIKQNPIEKIEIGRYCSKNGRNIQMRSSLLKGIIYQSAFLEKRFNNKPLNFYFWCTPRQLPQLDNLLYRDATVINKHLDSNELKFVKRLSKHILTYWCGTLAFFIALICLILKIL